MPAEHTDPVNGVRYTFKREGEDLIVDAWLAPGGALPEHLHPIQDERWSSVEGPVVFRVAGVDHHATPQDGEFLVAPHVRHAVRSASDHEVHLRCHVHPALDLEEFLVDAAAAAREGLVGRGGIPRSVRGARWGAAFLKRHQAQTVMCFPPRAIQKLMIATLARGA